jgi:chemosensory pili system protein ChpA (sensor histidine kinase/response regulator)
MSPKYLFGRTILVIENHAKVRFSLGEFLSRQGANPILVADGTEGLRVVQESLPDLVVADLQGPKEDDLRLLNAIHRKSKNGMGTPVIAMTPMISKQEVVEMQKAGFSTCLRKPFSPRRLLETISKLTKH